MCARAREIETRKDRKCSLGFHMSGTWYQQEKQKTIRENKLHILGHLSKRCRRNKIRRSLVSFARKLVIRRRLVPNTLLDVKRKVHFLILFVQKLI